jgi:TP901 family phage tail tape measure protein
MGLSVDEIKILVKAETDKALSNLKGVEEQSKKVDGGFKNIAKTSLQFAGVGSAIALVASQVKKAVSTIIEFDAAIGNVASISSVAREELKALALEAGRNTKFSATESAEALYFLASAGIESAEVMRDVLTPALMLATAGQISIQEATSVTVDVLKVFSGQGVEAAEVVDIMAKTVQSANTDMRQLSEGIKVAGSTAAVFGQDFKDFNVILAAMAERGQKGSEGAMKYRQAMVRLSSGMNEVQETLSKYNITQEEINKLLPTPIKLFKRLNAANLETGDAVKILGARQIAVFDVIRNGIDDIDRLNEKISDYEGAAKRAQDIQLDTIQGQLALLNSAYEDVILTLSGSSGLSEALKGLVKDAGDAMRAFGEWIRTSEGIQAITTAVNTLGLIFRTVWNGIIEPVFLALRGQAEITALQIQTLGQTIFFALSGNWEGVKIAWKNGTEAVKKIQNETNEKIIESYGKVGKSAVTLWDGLGKTYETKEKQRTDTSKQGANDRVGVAKKEAKAKVKIEEQYLKEREKLGKQADKIVDNEIKQRLDAIKAGTDKGLEIYEQGTVEENKIRKKAANDRYNEAIAQAKLANQTEVQLKQQLILEINKLDEQYDGFKATVDEQSHTRTLVMMRDILRAHVENNRQIQALSKETADKYGLTLEEATKLTQAELDKQEEAEKKRGEVAREVTSQIAGGLGDIMGGLEGLINPGVATALEEMFGIMKDVAEGNYAAAIVKGVMFIADAIAGGAMASKKAQQEVDEYNRTTSVQLRIEAAKEKLRIMEWEQEQFNKIMEERHQKELEEFDKSSEAGRAFNELKKKEQEERIANMSEEEREKFEIEKRYQDERKLLEEQQEAERQAAEEAQKIERNKMNRQIFIAEKSLAMNEASIKWQTMKMDIYKEYKWPWQKSARNSMLGMARSMYKQTANNISARTFLPELALGTDNAQGGPTIVGERGPEIVDMPKGAQVTPNNQINNTTSGSGGFTIFGPLTLNGVQNPRQLLQQLEAEANGMGSGVLNG